MQDNRRENDRYQIQVITFPLGKILEEKANTLTKICFRKERSEQEKKEHDDQFCSDSDRYRFILAVEDNTVIGSITLLKRAIQCEGKEIMLGGLGGVCTHPEKRKRGVASSLLRVAFQELEKAGCDIAYLCTDTTSLSKVGLYGQIGFTLLKKPYTYLGKSSKRYFEENGMIAPINSTAIFEAVLKKPQSFDIGTGNW